MKYSIATESKKYIFNTCDKLTKIKIKILHQLGQWGCTISHQAHQSENLKNTLGGNLCW